MSSVVLMDNSNGSSGNHLKNQVVCQKETKQANNLKTISPNFAYIMVPKLMEMKKLLITSVFVGALFYMAPSPTFAQEISTTTVDAKTQIKIEQSKEKIQKYNEQRRKAVEKLDNMRADFDKKNLAGRLSPNDVEKIMKKINKQSKTINKLEKKIAKEEKFISRNT